MKRVTVQAGLPTSTLIYWRPSKSFSLLPVSTPIKKKINFSSYLRKFRVEQLN